MFTVPKSVLNVPSPLNRLPSIMAFGTRFPPTFWDPSKVDRYKPLSMPTWQFRASASDRGVADVSSGIAATKQPDAQAKARELIIVLVNFVFIVIVSLSLFWPSLASRH